MLRALSGRTHRVLTAVRRADGPARRCCARQRLARALRAAAARRDRRLRGQRRALRQGRRLRDPERASPAGSHASKAATPVSWVCPCTRRPELLRHRPACASELGPAIRTNVAMQDILINWTPQETRVAVVENGAVQELHIERTLERGLVGNVYLGKVARVLPGMQSAFIDIGLERAAFLHVADLHPAGSTARGGQRAGDAPTADRAPGVRRPDADGAGDQGPDRHQGRAAVDADQHRRAHAGVPAAGQPHRHLAEDRLARAARAAARAHGRAGGRPDGPAAAASSCAPTPRKPPTPSWPTTSPTCARPGPAIRERALRVAARHAAAPGPEPGRARAARPDATTTRSRSASTRAAVRARCTAFGEHLHAAHGGASSSTTRGERPIFDLYNIDEEIARALARRVDLKSGGYLIIDQTEALTTIDVNTGGFVGARNFDDTIFKTNLEAAGAIARQLRLRNLGGIIIVDFIDMAREEHQAAVLAEFRKQLARDRTKMTVSGFTQLGLVEMTRKRTREIAGAHAVRAVPHLRGPRPGEDRAQRVLRHPARDPARGAPVQPEGVPHRRQRRGGRDAARRGEPAPGGPVRLHRQADLAVRPSRR